MHSKFVCKGVSKESFVKCTKYPDRDAGGVCSFSGKPYSIEELMEIDGKLVAKDNVPRLMAEMKDQIKTSQEQKPAMPMVFMNAGGAAAVSAPGPPAVYAVPVASKDKVTAGLLAVFLGGLGIHKFYLGRPIQGVLCILFCWTFIPTIVGAIEGIYYLVMSDQLWAARYGTVRYITQ